MKLVIKIMDAPAAPGGRALFLCDENGEPLPNQIGVTVTTEAGGVPLIEVKFAADGDAVRFE